MRDTFQTFPVPIRTKRYPEYDHCRDPNATGNGHLKASRVRPELDSAGT